MGVNSTAHDAVLVAHILRAICGNWCRCRQSFACGGPSGQWL